MTQNNRLLNPFIRTKDSTEMVMLDVIIALIPSIIMAWVAFGVSVLSLIAVSVGSALAAEFLFALIFLHRVDTLGDGSAIVTGLLLAFTLGAFTPLPVVSFGAAAAVIFGKLLWGGIGRNMFNPALVGREFMTVFFPAVMTSGSIWYNPDAVNHASLTVTGHPLFDDLLFRSSGAVGEYSIAALALGGLYLLIRRRITWHIPFSLLLTFTLSILLLNALGVEGLSFSLGGVVLGAVFMATDMPSSPSTTAGKYFYGGMLGLAAAVFILLGVRYEYMSYSILLMNGAVPFINYCFRPRIWGQEYNYPLAIYRGALLFFCILAVTVLISLASDAGFNPVMYLTGIFIAWLIVTFCMSEYKELCEKEN